MAVQLVLNRADWREQNLVHSKAARLVQIQVAMKADLKAFEKVA